MINAVIEELKNHQTQLDQDGVMVGVSRQALEELLAHVAAPAQPAPIAGLEPVAWQPIKTAPRDGTPILCFTPDYQSEFSDQSGIDVLWFDEGAWLYNAEPVTFQPTHWMPLPASPNSASSGYYTLAQLEAHAAEQVRPLVEALEGLIEAVELDADEGLEGIGSYTGARLTDAKNAIRARGQS